MEGGAEIVLLKGRKVWKPVKLLDMIKTKKLLWPVLLLLPALVIYGVFFIFPFFFTFYLSFMQWNLISPDIEPVGLQNYQNLFADKVFWISLTNTAFYVAVTVPLSMLLGLGLAVLVEGAGRYREVYRFLLFIPVVASLAVTSYVWMLLMNPTNGLINALLAYLEIAGPNWLNDPQWALLSLMIIGVWKALGYNIVLYIAGLKGIDKRLYEAAEMDGAGKWKQFTAITMPMLSPVHFFVLLVSIINSFQLFTTIHIMTHGAPNNATNVLVYEVWQEAFQFFDIGKASALSMVMFIVVLLITILQIRFSESKVHYQ
ncbi:sn-glycerol-3-phosphate transport system permease protein UgpA [Sporomusa silvacetica DSM 10669]|uniref:Sn-glycerol-3-phosphate transport system permease protein UgpA n=2 Tax=Sporomusa silvacetica TaxID=55504 RepID=A0ABZ3IIS1_9FIRM|nr:sugar ABC transporter permease [Sporomusa silvacetica]OZC18383.1 sn-glycerol-3-phosphate transport system permease protein UgpA [Sporomusa silvacetica DSM 10669]